jgi:uncharacterized protein (DUF169 family)
MTQKIAVQNIKNHLKFSTENETIEEIKRKPMHGLQHCKTISRSKKIPGVFILPRL